MTAKVRVCTCGNSDLQMVVKRTTAKRNVAKTVFKKKPVRTNRLIQPMKALEQKNFDTPVGPSALVASGFMAGQPLNLVVTGDSAGDRTGRKIMMKSFYQRYTFSSLAATRGQQIRILVVYDKQPNGALAAITDVLTVNDFNALNNLNNSERFVTVCDYVSPPVSGSTNLILSDKIFKKLNLETVYGTTAGTIADVNTGALIAYIGFNGPIDATCLISYKARIRFADP